MLRRPASAITLTALFALGCVNVTLPIGGHGELKEAVVHGSSGPKILLVQVDGVISEAAESDFFGGPGESPVSRLREELDLARKDEAIRALLVRINSPGGTVTASDIVYQELLRFKQERDIPVVAQFMGIAASGGYYVAMAADEIVAQPTTVTGSIGVIFGGVNLAGLLEKVGIEDQTLVSGSFKDTGSMLRRMTATERAQLQSVLNDMYGRFVEVVDTGRPDLERTTIQELADGRIYSAQQALEHGLVDRLGGLDESIEIAETRAGITSSRVVTYHRPDENHANFYATAARRRSMQALWGTHAWPKPPSSSFLYLWTPGTL